MKIMEVVKEALRVVVLAVISYLLTENVVSFLVSWFGGEALSKEMVIVVTGLLTSVLRGIEKQLHANKSKLSLPY